MENLSHLTEKAIETALNVRHLYHPTDGKFDKMIKAAKGVIFIESEDIEFKEDVFNMGCMSRKTNDDNETYFALQAAHSAYQANAYSLNGLYEWRVYSAGAYGAYAVTDAENAFNVRK